MRELLIVYLVDVGTWIVDNIGYPIATAVGAGFNWMLNKRKNNAEAKTVELSNEAQIINKWMQWGEKMEQEVASLQRDLQKQRENCDADTERLQAQIVELEHRVVELERENHDLKRK